MTRSPVADLTTDPNDPRLGRGEDRAPGPQNEAYLVLSDEELKKGFVRPLRDSYVHKTCGVQTRMSYELAATYARNPKFYGSTYCISCRMHKPVAEFTWTGTTSVVGS